MDLEYSPEVIVHFQQQTSTLDLSDADFALKTSAAAAKVKARQSEECAVAKGTSKPSAEVARLSSITEDAQVGLLEERELIQGDNVSLEAHPGSLVRGPFCMPDEPTEIDVSDTASDTTERPSGETKTSANDSTFNLPAQLAIKQGDGSYKDLTSQIAIKRPDGSYMDLNLEDIAPFALQDDVNTQLRRPSYTTYQALPEIAPWLHQQGESSPSTPSKMPRSTLQTPPASIGKASRLVPPKSKRTEADIDDHGFAHFLLRCLPTVANNHAQLPNHSRWKLYPQADHTYVSHKHFCRCLYSLTKVVGLEITEAQQ